MANAFTFHVTKINFDEDYTPSHNTRITTNFANLARGPRRKENLRNTLQMIDNRCNALAYWDNPKGDRYSVKLAILSVDLTIDGQKTSGRFPLIEILKADIIDHKKQKIIEGSAGNNFSSYLRDYDFSCLLPDHNKGKSSFSLPENFGLLHGQLFKHFVSSEAYRDHFSKKPVICLSVAGSRIYHRSDNSHPILGIEYLQDNRSLTDQYFGKMGLAVRYFMPKGAVAPLAFYYSGDLLSDYSDMELISAISTMETFQKIYRPEIYNANAVAGSVFHPSLANQDFSLTRIEYDREERNSLAAEQGKFAEEHFIKPHQSTLARWSASIAL